MPSVFLFPWKKSPSMLTHHRGESRSGRNSCSPRGCGGPLLPLHKRKTWCKPWKNSSLTRQPFLSFQAPLRLCSKVSEAAALLPAVRVLLAPAALPIQMHFLTVIAEVTTPTASRGTKISSSNNVTVAQLLAYTLL